MRLTFLISFVLFIEGATAQSLERLGPAVNSEYHEINPVLSPDGKTLYFVRINHPENSFGKSDSEDIWFSTLTDENTWTDARRIPELNIGRYNAVLSVSADGNTLLLHGVFNKKGNIWKSRGLSLSQRDGDVWSAPQKLKVSKLSRKNRGLQSSASMSADGEHILLSFSRTFNGKRNDLYYIRKKKKGNWSRPVKLKGVNSGASDEAPFLAHDGKTLYFASNRKKGSDFDVYQAERKNDNMKEWSKPVPLSEPVNSPLWESYFKTDSSGSWAYYSSTAISQDNADIFRVQLPDRSADVPDNDDQ